MATSTATIRTQPRVGFPVGTAVLWLLVVFGAIAAILRFTQGLGAITNLSDARPWGLWIAFDVMSGVALSAGGFTLAAIVYIFRIKRFYPLLRPTLLTAFLGYLLAAGAILFDLGQPTRFYHPFFFWNHHSVMFEVAWCVLTYLFVLTIENSQLALERLGWSSLLRFVHWITIPAVILGIVLSTMHQSALGSLFLLTPYRLNILWYTPILPVLFYISAIMVGMGMIIFESTLSAKAFNRPVELHLLSEIGRWLVYVLGLYLTLKVGDIAVAGELGSLFNFSPASQLMLAEISIGVVAPLAILSNPSMRQRGGPLFTAAAMVVFGVVLNRFNVCYVAHNENVVYLPTWGEFAVTAGLTALGVLLYIFAVKNFKVLDVHPARAH
jgi:Ni/Fe-hydrogenase subunit HybB-like protein